MNYATNGSDKKYFVVTIYPFNLRYSGIPIILVGIPITASFYREILFIKGIRIAAKKGCECLASVFIFHIFATTK